MLVINPKQFGVFRAEAETRFAQQLAEYFWKRHDRTVVRLPAGEITVGRLAAATVLEMVTSGIARARKYGIRGQAATAGFLTVMFEAAPNFDEDPYLNRYLWDADVPANSRVDHLLERATEEDWAAVKESYDPAAWGVSEHG